ncbi:MAG: alanine racemase [Phycisphaeraceae bacterium]|nr:alanine racemase [Phycisphaeraceae bacterium]MCP4070020.1 alanine racemase [Phycisphaeraceae bacterium]MCP4796059.1 alanine racemase [Phycisphaeraceae bacterium]
MTTTSSIRIDLDALEGNLEAIARLVGGGNPAPDRICAVVKSDAYGLGAARIAGSMASMGIRNFAAYQPQEAIEVATAARGASVLVLMPVHQLDRAGAARHLLASGRLHYTAHTLEQVRDLEAEAAPLGIVLPVHLELDTGMGRGGCEEPDARRILETVAGSRRLRLAGVMTHLPDALDDPDTARERGRRFRRFLEDAGDLVPDDAVRHVSATAALQDASLRFDMARIGLGWTGHLPRPASTDRSGLRLRPAISWWSRLVQVRRIEAGRTIGYGCTERIERDTIAGLVPVGYADGLPPSRVGGHRVVVHGKHGPVAAPVLGRMNMDQCVVDLTDVGPVDADASVEVVSSDPDSVVSLPRVAARADVMPYELLCGLSPRIPRVVVAGGSLAESDRPASIESKTAVRGPRVGFG